MSDGSLATPGEDVRGEVPQLVAHLFRRSAGAIAAGLMRRHGLQALAQAEEAVQDALLEALRCWPYEGIPREPAAWLRTVSQRKLFDAMRREGAQARAVSRIGDGMATGEDTGRADVPSDEPLRDDVLDDDVIAMLFACCTPRLERVLQVVYLRFNEGYVATEGDAVMRAELCREAARLAVLLAEHPVTGTPEASALAALLLFQLARLPARAAADGTPVLLERQDRSAWDASLIAAAYRHLARAGRGEHLTSLHLQAEIASRHAMAAHFDLTDWPAILEAYDLLLAREPTVVVRVNRAVAVGHVHGTGAALAALQEGDAEREASETGYRWYFAVRGHFRARAGDAVGAADDLRRAAALTRSTPLLRWLEERHSALLDSSA